MIDISKRIKKFKQEIVSQIPRFPNDRASLQALEAKHLTDLLVTYIGWRLRYVARRPRTVAGQSNLAGDSRAAVLQANITAFIRAVETGDDLTSYLSNKPHTRGYTPAADSGNPGGDTWADKDFLLNVMGLHHFHLPLSREANGQKTRTNDVIFASVTRDEFEIVGLFDHSAFDHDDNGTMTPERTRLWNVFTARQAAGTLPGQLTTGGYGGLGITTSSAPVAVVRAAQRHVRILQQVDSKLDDPSYVQGLYDRAAPQKPTLRWCYNHLDLGLLDEQVGFFGVLERGPN